MSNFFSRCWILELAVPWLMNRKVGYSRKMERKNPGRPKRCGRVFWTICLVQWCRLFHCSLSNIYPNNCDPTAVFETQDVRRRSLFFPDVMLKGYYPTYIYRLWKEHDVTISMEDGDLELIRNNTNDFLAFSYYRTTTHEAGQPYFGDTGGDVGTPNPYLETSDWDGRSIRWDSVIL